VRTPDGFRHGLRVRIGSVDGPKGVLLRCERRDGSGIYWKVRLQDGRWIFPDDVIVDGRGDRVGTCGDCGLRFVNTGVELICDRCNAEVFGRATAPVPTPTGAPIGRYHYGRHLRPRRR